MKISITVNNIKIKTFHKFTILQICENLNIFIPRFCYHSKLSIAGNCRMCLIEVKNNIKPIVSCSTPIINNMEIYTNTPLVKKARENILEFLLINHPLDCPICDQGGECDLQEQTLFYGSDTSKFIFLKRSVQNKNLGPFIKTIMTRCIHCTRCVRFGQEIAGIYELGTIGRGYQTEISNFLNKFMISDLSGNIIDLCPVGALTSKPYAFKARSWEISKKTTSDCLNSLSSSIRVDVLNNKILRVLPNKNIFNTSWISDKTRFSFDGLIYQRLKKPLLKKNNQFIEISWEKSFNIIKKKINNTDPTQTLSLVDNLIDLETSYSIKHFLNLKGISKIYTLTPLNNQNDLLIYTFNFQKLNLTHLCLLLFCDLKAENILLNVHLKNRYNISSLLIYTIGNKLNLTYPTFHLGNNLNIILKILEGKHLLCSKIKNLQNPLIIIGSNFFKLKNNSNLLMFLQKYFKINIMYYHISAFNFIQNNIKYKNPIIKNKIKLLFLYNIQQSLKGLHKSNFKIYQGTHFNHIAQQSDLILPSTSYFEKNSTYINILNDFKKTTSIIKTEIPSDFLILKIYFLLYNFKTSKKKYILNKIYFLIPVLNTKISSSMLIFNTQNILFYKHQTQIFIKNYYLDTNITQNSKLMALRTKTLLPFFNNFKLC